MSYTYTSFQKALAIEMAVPNNDPTNVQFVAILPTLIDQAEQRCYRDLDLLAATITQVFQSSTVNRVLNFAYTNALPGFPGVTQTQILIPEDVYAITPNGFTGSPPGVANQMFPVSRDWLMAVYGDPTIVGVPQYFAPLTDTTMLIAPLPTLSYNIIITGKSRPLPLYSAPPNNGTQTTFLTSVLPDLFLAAAVHAATGYQHNWGAQADDPRSAMSWEANYQALLATAKGEEMRKKYHGWMSMTSEIPAMPSQPGTPGPA